MGTRLNHGKDTISILVNVLLFSEQKQQPKEQIIKISNSYFKRLRIGPLNVSA